MLSVDSGRSMTSSARSYTINALVLRCSQRLSFGDFFRRFLAASKDEWALHSSPQSSSQHTFAQHCHFAFQIAVHGLHILVVNPSARLVEVAS